MSEREEKIASLRSELEALESETADELEATLSEAEETVTEAAKDSTSDTGDAKETLEEAEREIAETVDETAKEVAAEVGEPDLAPAIADHLFRKLEDRGYLPNQSDSAVIHEAEGHVETVPTEIAEEAARPVEAAESTVDEPPSTQHWFFRERRVRR